MKLEALGVEFSYNSHPILDVCQFKYRTGQFVSIVGPNGSGKSTLLRCLDRILKPRKGTILIDKTGY